MKISFVKPSMPRSGAVVVGVSEKNKLSPAAAELDGLTGGAVKRAIAASQFEGKKKQSLAIIAPDGVKLRRILLVGLGKELDDLGLQELGGNIVAQMNTAGEKSVSVIVDAGAEDLAQAAAQIAYGADLRDYSFDKYKKKTKKKKPGIETLTMIVEGEARARRAFGPMSKVVEGVFFTRDLVSEPPNVLYPVSFAREARKLVRLGVKVEVLGEAAMKKRGMNALLGVGQGSRRDSQLVVMQWQGGPKDQKPTAFVGKGVTFDTGGISLKPGAGMADMKWDMGGAGAVAGLMKALAGRKAKVNAVGILGLVENMPDGNAQRPGDVVTSMSGQTIEILNTDAEGRLVLADALWYCQERFKPRLVVDLATLTGAILVSLAKEYAGMFCNDDKLAEQLNAAGLASGEKVWRMPLGEAYDKMIDSKIADMKNIGGRWGGSITAAQFLQRYIKKDVPWAHLDIAGMAWSDKNTATVPAGGTGYGVRLLDRFVRDNCE
jgi:leucyl aminopeptidase